MVFSFRFLLYSLFLRPFGLRSVTIFKPCEKTSMPLTEPDLQISSIRLFSLTRLAVLRNLSVMFSLSLCIGITFIISQR